MVMNTKSDAFFTDSEKKSIEAAIKEAESRTSGEIVTMVVEQSDSYRDINVLAGIIISAMISMFPAEIVFANSELLLRKFIPSMSWFNQIPDGVRFFAGMSVFIALTIILYFPVKFIFSKFPSLRRTILSIKRMDEEVRERALKGFHEHGLGNTKDATGVLFLLSVFERRVHVLADHGIYTKINQETLDKYATSIGRGIADGKGAEALCGAIKDAGKELEKHFPRKSDDRNELSNRIVTER
jgi:putative membrane protein